jgi:transcriptional regulator with XRE-family HTH domain
MRRADQNSSGHEKLAAVWKRKKKDLGLTQESVAEKFGYASQGSVSDYLNGRNKLNLPTAIKFARLLEVHLSEIWDGDPEMVFMSLPLEEIREIALGLPYEDQLELASILLQNARQQRTEK